MSREIGSKISIANRSLISLLAVFVCLGASARPVAGMSWMPTAVLKVDTSKLGAAFDSGAVGISLETKELSGARLNANDLRLVQLMRMLGPSLLRIGGNSVDVSWWTSHGERSPLWATSTVTPADLSALRGLLDATNWRVLIGLNLGHMSLVRQTDEARQAQQILGTRLAGIEIGNEPDDYGRIEGPLRPFTYNISDYLREVDVYRQTLETAVPGLAIYGPALSGTSWLSQMGAATSMFAEITQHFYPTNNCHTTSSIANGVAPPTAEGLLSSAVRRQENITLGVLARVGLLAGRPTRIGETNDVSCSGSASASPVFASALWALDWALRAVNSGAQGVNFHAGLGICGSHSQSPICAPNGAAARVTEVVAQPEYYGLLAASQLEGGRFVQTSTAGPVSNITAWATVKPNGKLTISIEDFATNGSVQPLSISVPGYSIAVLERLMAPSIHATNLVTLGRVHVTSDGRWRPRPVRLRAGRLRHARHVFRVLLHSASAVIVTLYPQR